MSGGNLVSNIKIKGANGMVENRHLHNQSVSVVPTSQTGYGKLNMSSNDNLTQAAKKSAMHQKNQSVNARSSMQNQNNQIVLNNSASIINASQGKALHNSIVGGVTSASPGDKRIDNNSNQIRQSLSKQK